MGAQRKVGDGSMTTNIAWPGHPVIQEIIRRKSEGIVGNSQAASQGQDKLGLVVEGGGMRGVYSGGCLVAMEELGLAGVFDQVYGESAGAINACYFLAGQGAFGIRIYLDDLTSLKFANPLRFGTMLDLDYAIDVVVKSLKPLNVQRVLASPSDLYIAVTSLKTGQSRLIDVKRERLPLLTLLKATAAIVPLYNRGVTLGNEPYADGGIANPIPVASAIEAGCTRILVLLTRPPEHVSIGYSSLQRFCMSPMFWKWPRQFVQSFHQRQASRYNETRAIALGTRAIKEGVRIAVIAPGSDSPMLERATTNRKRLLAASEDAITRTLAAFRDFQQVPQKGA
jgi:predicted patatin/cPLA2 family phospholipase